MDLTIMCNVESILYCTKELIVNKQEQTLTLRCLISVVFR